jgi:hypothetical protein
VIYRRVYGSENEFASAPSQAQYDKLKRRALLAPTVSTNQPGINHASAPDLRPPGVVGIDMNGVCVPPAPSRDTLIKDES